MTTKTQKKKLLVWAGFTYRVNQPVFGFLATSRTGWYYRGNFVSEQLPKMTLEFIDKYLVPKLHSILITKDSYSLWHVGIQHGMYRHTSVSLREAFLNALIELTEE